MTQWEKFKDTYLTERGGDLERALDALTPQQWIFVVSAFDRTFWMRMRGGKDNISASYAAELIGLGYKSGKAIWALEHEGIEPPPVGEVQQRKMNNGLANEEKLKDEMAIALEGNGLYVVKKCGTLCKDGFSCTPDAILLDFRNPDAPEYTNVEIKSTESDNTFSSEWPTDNHAIQVLMQQRLLDSVCGSVLLYHHTGNNSKKAYWFPRNRAVEEAIALACVAAREEMKQNAYSVAALKAKKDAVTRILHPYYHTTRLVDPSFLSKENKKE